ncbi:MAG: hypothetical protein RLY93_00790 [Sumerlaeia bacterium]
MRRPRDRFRLALWTGGAILAVLLLWHFVLVDRRVVYDRVSGGLLLRVSGIERGMPRAELLWPGEEAVELGGSLGTQRFSARMERAGGHSVLLVDVEFPDQFVVNYTLATYLRRGKDGQFDMTGCGVESMQSNFSVPAVEYELQDIWIPVRDVRRVLPVLQALDAREWRSAALLVEEMLEDDPDDPFLLCLALDTTILAADRDVYLTTVFLDRLAGLEPRLAGSERPFAEQALAYYRALAAQASPTDHSHFIPPERDILLGPRFDSLDELFAVAESLRTGQAVIGLPSPFLLSRHVFGASPISLETFRLHMDSIEVEIDRRLLAGEPREAARLALGLLRAGQGARTAVDEGFARAAEGAALDALERVLLEGPPNAALMEYLWPELSELLLASRQITYARTTVRAVKESLSPHWIHLRPRELARDQALHARLGLLLTAVAVRHALAQGATFGDGPVFPVPLLDRPLPDPSLDNQAELRTESASPHEAVISVADPMRLVSNPEFTPPDELRERYTRRITLEPRWAFPPEGQPMGGTYEELRQRWLEGGLPLDPFIRGHLHSYLLVDSDPPRIVSTGPDKEDHAGFNSPWQPATAIMPRGRKPAFTRTPSDVFTVASCTPGSTTLRAILWSPLSGGEALETECFTPQSPFRFEAPSHRGMDIVIWEGDTATSPALEASPE